MSLSGHSFQLPSLRRTVFHCPGLFQEMLPCPSGAGRAAWSLGSQGWNQTSIPAPEAPQGAPPRTVALGLCATCVWSLSQAARSSGSGGHHITSLGPQRLCCQQEGTKSGWREPVTLSLNQDARTFAGLPAIHSTPVHGAVRSVQQRNAGEQAAG